NYIESKEKKSISEIFTQHGEIYFRLKETVYLTELLNSSNNFVLSVGGGTPCYAKNSQLISNNSTSIYLKASLNTLYNRLKKQRKKRPLIADLKLENLKEFIAKHLFERIIFYEQAKHTILTDGKTIAAIVTEIKRLNKKLEVE
ncbi:MAG: hypothetical protein L3J54_09605, partial [Draconibacterium sp.]|nr:hypothetical protein [Draconibacterium sp.]